MKRRRKKPRGTPVSQIVVQAAAKVYAEQLEKDVYDKLPPEPRMTARQFIAERDEKRRQEMLDPFDPFRPEPVPGGVIFPHYEALKAADEIIKRYPLAMAVLAAYESQQVTALGDLYRALDAQFPVAKRNWWQRQWDAYMRWIELTRDRGYTMWDW